MVAALVIRKINALEALVFFTGIPVLDFREPLLTLSSFHSTLSLWRLFLEEPQLQKANSAAYNNCCEYNKR